MTETLRDYFAGSWALLRRLEDRRQRQTGSILGQASFAPDGAGLSYAEHGQIAFGSHRGPVFRRYRYAFPSAQRAEVRFEDGRFFHSLDLSAGPAEATHRCGEDFYRGRLERLADHCWQARWRVTGPRKDLVLTSQYLRFKGG